MAHCIKVGEVMYCIEDPFEIKTNISTPQYRFLTWIIGNKKTKKNFYLNILGFPNDVDRCSVYWEIFNDGEELNENPELKVVDPLEIGVPVIMYISASPQSMIHINIDNDSANALKNFLEN